MNPIRLLFGDNSTAKVELRVAPGYVHTIQNTVFLEQKVEELFNQWREPIYRYLVAAFGFSVEAEDITQDSFVQLYRTVRGGQAIENTRAWLYRTAHNRALDQIKHRKFLSPVGDETWETILAAMPDLAPNPEEDLLENERMMRIHEAMRMLSVQERQCLHLRSNGFRYREIAEIMNVAIPTVGEYLKRGINKLSKVR
jgi:RNA polymerase sigma-70 factor (ECF subfamily)